MSARAYRAIRDYGIIGDCHSAALVSSTGSIDWWCPARFDAPSVFARLLDLERGGHWYIRPVSRAAVERTYLPQTNVLRTSFRTSRGEVTLTDFMPLSTAALLAGGEARHAPQIGRTVACTTGHAELELEFTPRFAYGGEVPTLVLIDGTGALARGRNESLSLFTEVPLHRDDDRLMARFTLQAGERAHFLAVWSDSARPHLEPPLAAHALEDGLARTAAIWRDWAASCRYQGPYREHVQRSALALKLLQYAPTGAIIAAPTTSLPEELGGVRNWDYRFTWLRDASQTVYALFLAGHIAEAEAYMDWTCAIARVCEAHLQVLYGVAGERDLPEQELALRGYRGARPVRIGNAAAHQVQLDVYGELLDCVDLCRRFGHNRQSPMWGTFHALVDWVCDHWHEPDCGIWEVRSEPRHFVHSKVMAWVAVDRGIQAAEALGLPADLDRWRRARAAIKAEALERGWDERLGSFVQAYDYPALDAANLRLPLVGFIAADHPKMRATIEKTQQVLTRDGLVYRYLDADDGLPGGEATFAVCTFWLINDLIFLGRHNEARRLFDTILNYTSDLGLLAEEIDPATRELLGNFPQAFSHIGLINCAINLARVGTGGTITGAEAAVAGSTLSPPQVEPPDASTPRARRPRKQRS